MEDFKINSFVISADTRNKMEDVIRSSRRSGYEAGFALCTTDNNIIPGEDYLSFSKFKTLGLIRCLKKDRESGATVIGDFHTHTRKYAEDFSTHDMYNACKRDYYKLACIGKTRENKIKCFIKGEKECLNDADEIAKPMRDLVIRLREGKMSESEFNKIKNKYHKEVVQPKVKEYFKEVEIPVTKSVSILDKIIERLVQYRPEEID